MLVAYTIAYNMSGTLRSAELSCKGKSYKSPWLVIATLDFTECRVKRRVQESCESLRHSTEMYDGESYHHQPICKRKVDEAFLAIDYNTLRYTAFAHGKGRASPCSILSLKARAQEAVRAILLHSHNLLTSRQEILLDRNIPGIKLPPLSLCLACPWHELFAPILQTLSWTVKTPRNEHGCSDMSSVCEATYGCL